MVRILVLCALLGLPLLAHAQSVMQGVDASGVRRTVKVDADGNLTASNAAQTGGAFSNVAVTNAVGGTTVGGLSGRRTIIIQNLGPNAIYCGVTAAGTAPTTSTGLKLPANGGERAYDVASGLVLKCIAETAAQVSPADTRYQEIK